MLTMLLRMTTPLTLTMMSWEHRGRVTGDLLATFLFIFAGWVSLFTLTRCDYSVTIVTILTIARCDYSDRVKMIGGLPSQSSVRHQRRQSADTDTTI